MEENPEEETNEISEENSAEATNENEELKAVETTSLDENETHHEEAGDTAEPEYKNE